jgi:hypothetical protein
MSEEPETCVIAPNVSFANAHYLTQQLKNITKLHSRHHHCYLFVIKFNLTFELKKKQREDIGRNLYEHHINVFRLI